MVHCSAILPARIRFLPFCPCLPARRALPPRYRLPRNPFHPWRRCCKCPRNQLHQRPPSTAAINGLLPLRSNPPPRNRGSRQRQAAFPAPKIPFPSPLRSNQTQTDTELTRPLRLRRSPSPTRAPLCANGRRGEAARGYRWTRVASCTASPGTSGRRRGPRRAGRVLPQGRHD